MDKLKTLKDIMEDNKYDDNSRYFSYQHSKILKEEAIKWVKHWKKELNTLAEVHGYRSILEGEIEAFMEFFNITDEELKT